MLWLWELRDIGIIGVGLLISVLALTQTGIALPLVLTAVYPLSAYRGFFGSRPFSRTNNFLKEHGVEPIDWQIENV